MEAVMVSPFCFPHIVPTDLKGHVGQQNFAINIKSFNTSVVSEKLYIPWLCLLDLKSSDCTKQGSQFFNSAISDVFYDNLTSFI